MNNVIKKLRNEIKIFYVSFDFFNNMITYKNCGEPAKESFSSIAIQKIERNDIRSRIYDKRYGGSGGSAEIEVRINYQICLNV